MTGVYWIKLSEKHYYIGSSKQLDARLKRHRQKLENGIHYNKHMQSVFNIYGVFEPKILLYCDKDNVLFYEQRILDAHYGKPECVNLSRDATGGGPCGLTPWNKGLTASEEAKRKMSEAKKGKPGPWTGKKRPPLSEEHKRKLSESVKLGKAKRKAQNESE